MQESLSTSKKKQILGKKQGRETKKKGKIGGMVTIYILSSLHLLLVF